MTKSLALLVSTCDEARYWSLLSLAAAKAALGVRVSVFLSGDATALARREAVFVSDHRYQQKGVATLAQLMDSCLELSVAFTVCQTGMHLCDIAIDQLRSGMTPGGLMAWLSEQKNSELIFA
jgi:peroxiredoxin family protein